MPNSTLFPLELQPIAPAPDRREPVLWLKRLVILSSLNSSAIVREIEFRRGLNIIQTRQIENPGQRVAATRSRLSSARTGLFQGRTGSSFDPRGPRMPRRRSRPKATIGVPWSIRRCVSTLTGTS